MTGRAVAMLDAFAAERLIKLLGLLGSDAEGERATAGRMADELIRRHGLTWPEVIRIPTAEPAPRWAEPCTVAEALECAVAYIDLLTPWETKFVRDLQRKRVWRLSEKQHDILDQIIEKIQAQHKREAA